MDVSKLKPGDRLVIVALEPRFYAVPSQGLEVGRKVTVTRVEPTTVAQAAQIWAMPDDAADVPCGGGWPFLSYNLGEIKEAACNDT